MRAFLQFGIPIAMIAWGALFFLSYTRKLAKEQKEFGERYHISRGLSEGFHFYSAKVVALVVAVLGLAILLWQLLGNR